MFDYPKVSATNRGRRIVDLSSDPVGPRCWLMYKYLIERDLQISKDQIQFQKGQRLRDFLDRYGTDQQSAQALFHAR